MEDKRQDLKVLAEQGLIDINPELINELSDDAVKKTSKHIR